MRVPRQIPIIVASVAWLMFVVSQFLPTMTVGGTEVLTGWEVSTAWLECFRDPLFFVVMFMKPGFLLLLIVPFIALAMLAGPLPVLVWDDAWVLGGVFISFSSLVYLLKIGSEALIGVGFYLWFLSILFMGVACFLRSRTTLPNNSLQATAAAPSGCD
jgi:hypothetical protein